MDKGAYCVQVCGGRCCTLHAENNQRVKCPRQSQDGSCSIYNIRYSPPLSEERLVKVGEWQDVTGAIRPFVCGRIDEIIAHKLLPEEIAQGCCYVHPELLEEE